MPVVQKLAIIGQGLIGSSITRAAHVNGAAGQIVITDASPKVRARLRELGIGQAKVVDTSIEAVKDADLVIACIPVGQFSALAAEIAPHLKPGAIFSDVGSVKMSVFADVSKHLPKSVHFIPAHPLAGTEQSGPDSGLSDLFVDRWCILTPGDNVPEDAVATVWDFWEKLGSQVETMTPAHHDRVLAITSHVPHALAFTIFQTALRNEEITNSEVMKFSAGGFRDFTRIASSNPTMWRDIFLNNKTEILEVLGQFREDLEVLERAIREGNAKKLFDMLSESRLTRRRVIEKEHISVVSETRRKENDAREERLLIRPYSSED
jgi:cyclohexadieny/prephenate dehydrogenase